MPSHCVNTSFPVISLQHAAESAAITSTVEVVRDSSLRKNKFKFINVVHDY